ncbi:hypothetical protein GCM10022244_05360 [Streptomyces gulbargensis]|uniref:Transposase n=1 Tax=Streptomyces gulbargensis TaxID=364901 RepID=A0ABP7LC90_9ACTN
MPLPGPGQARVQIRRPRMTVRARRAANWALTAYPWTGTQAVDKVTCGRPGWGYTHPHDTRLEQTVRLLADAATTDHGRPISIHLADQDDMLLIAVLSHTSAVPDDTILADSPPSPARRAAAPTPPTTAGASGPSCPPNAPATASLPRPDHTLPPLQEDEPAGVSMRDGPSDHHDHEADLPERPGLRATCAERCFSRLKQNRALATR